jgi:beta-lactamase class A
MSRLAGRPATLVAVVTALVLAGAMLIVYGLHRGNGVGQNAAAVGPLVRDSPSPSPSPSPKPDPAIGVRAQVASYLASSGTHAALALLDQDTGEKVYYQEHQQFNTASIIKVDILATVLYQHQKAGKKLSSTESSNATKMITQSDNNAATSLWNDIGKGPGLAAANKDFGLTETVPGDGGYWGLTKTTAADQLRLLQMISNPSGSAPADPPAGAPPATAAGHGTPGPLDAASCDYLFSLMNRVEKDQRWGVPQAASAQATNVYVKNGWLSYSADNYKWITNSVGRIIEPGHDWLVVVLSNYHPTMDNGIDQIEHAADLAVSGLRSATS